MEALESAVLCGISPLEFWELTPFEFSLVTKAYIQKKEEESEERLTLAYINAMWTAQWFAKKGHQPKSLKEILEGIDRSKKQMTDDEMFMKAKALNALFGGEVKVIDGKE